MLGDVKSINPCEYTSVIHSLYYTFLMDGVKKIDIHTDRIDIVQCGRNKKRLRMPRFVAELLETLEIVREYEVEVQIHHVKAHSGDKMNDFIDRSSRKELRKYLKNQNNEINYKIKHLDSYCSNVHRM